MYCHSTISCLSVTFHFVFCFLPCFFFPFILSRPGSTSCFVLYRAGVFLTMPFLRKHASRKLHPPYQVSVPAPQHVGGFVWDFLGKWVLCIRLLFPTGWNVTAGCPAAAAAAVWVCCNYAFFLRSNRNYLCQVQALTVSAFNSCHSGSDHSPKEVCCYSPWFKLDGSCCFLF